MSRHEIDGLIQTLRRASAQYYQLAAASRSASHPRHKARKHAQALHLSVSIEAASKLDHKYISTIPLPVLDLVPSVSPETSQDATGVTAGPDIVAPIPRYPSQIGTDPLAKEIKRPVQPVLRCVTMDGDVVSPVRSHILISKWSSSTVGTAETEESDEVDDTLSDREVPQPAHIGVRYPRDDDNDENMDILVSPDDDLENDEASPWQGHPQSTLYLSPSIIQLTQLQSQNHPLSPTHIPRDATPAQRYQKSSPRAADVPVLAHLSSGSDSSQSSLGLVTPVSISLPLLQDPV